MPELQATVLPGNMCRRLVNLADTTRVTLHYDTTSRSRIDGEWPALILNLLDKDPEKCKMVRLRALFFAYSTDL